MGTETEEEKFYRLQNRKREAELQAYRDIMKWLKWIFVYPFIAFICVAVFNILLAWLRG